MTTPRRALIEDDGPTPAPAPTGGGGWKPWVIGALAVTVVGGGIGYAVSQRGDGNASTNTSSSHPGEHSASESHQQSNHTDPSSADPSQAGTSSAEPASSAPSSASAPSADESAATKALNACRATVQAGDAVIAEGKVGSGHWSEHVQAQTDNFAGKIDAEELKAIFTRTRLAGPADLQRYDAARAALSKASGDCDPVSGASAAVAEQLATCKLRGDAQTPVLAATDATMTAWRNHQADMARSRHEHVPEAQDIWITTWKAAPPAINAWKKAVSEYTPPQC